MIRDPAFLGEEAVILPPPFVHLPYNEISSTQDIAREKAQAGDQNFIVTAKVQKLGRGRLGRPWSSPEGNFYATLMLQPQKSLRYWAELSFLVGVAFAETFEGLLGCPLKLKWPNDLILNDAKCGGILIETVELPNKEMAVLIGTGVNLSFAPENTPYPATSFAAETGTILTVSEVLESYLRHLQTLLQSWEQDGFDELRLKWLKRAWRLGEKIGYKSAQEENQTGIFVDIDQQGCLILQDQHSKLTTRILTGDVLFPED